MNEPIPISDEAREAARQIRTSSVKSLVEHFVQLAINSATEKLTKERAATEELTKEFLVKLSNRITVLENDLACAREISGKLTKENEELRHQIGTDFMAGVVIEKDKTIQTLEQALRNLYEQTLCLKTVENEKLFEAFNEAEKALGIR